MGLKVICVLKSGGVYDREWVRKLKEGVAQHMSQPHDFVCLSDVEVDCERIPLQHDWTGWWSKVELFRPGVIKGPTLYLDLDTIITGPRDDFTDLPYDFAMLENFNSPDMVGSGMMWFKDEAPSIVYDRFVLGPERIIEHYRNMKHGSYMGDQAYIWDCMDRKVNTIASPKLRSYKRHCRNGLPEGTSIVCFHGRPRPTEINPDWMRNWV